MSNDPLQLSGDGQTVGFQEERHSAQDEDRSDDDNLLRYKLEIRQYVMFCNIFS